MSTETNLSERIRPDCEAAPWVVEEVKALEATIDSLTQDKAALEEALADMLAGWRYIREHHGDLYGVGWDRAQEKAEKALAHRGSNDE